jgi:hypothetical protein
VCKRAAMLLEPPLLAAAVYAGAIHNPFVYDDVPMVVDNPSLRDRSNFRFVRSQPHLPASAQQPAHARRVRGGCEPAVRHPG